ncbi:putative defense protein 3 [Diabrotica undecimpunctata]|uniref:putative defense protein 3 n=1 Tax=Diabrotica undecimpunctata TaxID=50387 RepID=UPI003B63DA8D
MFKLLVLLSVVYYTHAYSTGAPLEVCDDMTPKHPFNPQASEIPYKFGLSKNEVKGGEQVEITISGLFKGLLLEVREGDKAVGEWVVADNDPDFQTLNCHNNKNSAITHKNANDKSNVKLVWKAPNKTGKYVLYATVAETGERYWARKPTEVINVF